ncbi:MAG: protein translocase subunit SecF, partial [Elusimicrobiota bacterium]
ARFKKEEEGRGLDDRLARALGAIAPDGSSKILSKDFVGAVVGEKLRSQALMAILLSFLGIIVYVGFRFRNLVWGVAGVIALVHDVVATVGFLALTGYELDLVLVAALLTIAGFSINDTVVIFDRLRERLRIYTRETLQESINRSLNETLSRTILTSATVFFVTAVLCLWGGRSIHPFAVAMLFGVIVGVYSTIGVASNLVHSWSQWTGQKSR